MYYTKLTIDRVTPKSLKDILLKTREEDKRLDSTVQRDLQKVAAASDDDKSDVEMN